ncbi:hypothetical protein RM549_08660 [Salegentibacter sp. F188]|uniref:Lipocalin-like domain-containing protein n=1 Tax=Autumnicola patrickiae TaxID=3075591 RepID=A0ABU3E1H9_9FLAO|nr:hypothetical protein [Salegentibacter sp. F188]MDT0689854.1 hypothetical protein [Salegentibacter sp. F188]
MKRLLSLIVIFTLISCSSDDENISNEKNLLGVWENTYEINNEDYPDLEEGNYEYVLQYEFLSDKTFESYTFLRNTSTNTIEGYHVQTKGSFTTEGDRMSLIFDQWNSNIESTQFVSLDELILIQEDGESSFDYSVNQEELVFNFDPCGPLESCLADITFERDAEVQ